MKSVLCFLVAIVVFISHAPAQNMSQSNYTFTEAWVWEYQNIRSEEGQVIIYRNPLTQEWLLTPDAYGKTDEMTLWYLIKPNGEVIQASKDPEHNKNIIYTQHHLYPTRNDQFPKTWVKGKLQKSFGSEQSLRIFQGQEYTFKHPRVSETSQYFVSKMEYDMSLICQFVNLRQKAQMPIEFPIELPNNYIFLSEHTQKVGGYTTSTIFKGIQHVEYTIQIPQVTTK